MRVLVVAMTMAGGAFVVHWLIWRVRIPRRQTAALLAIFMLALPVGLVVATTTSAGAGPWLRTPWECLHVSLWHVAFMLAYIVAYSAIEERSPSMSLLCHVADAPPPGPTRAELMEAVRVVSPVEIRLGNMLRDGMVRQDVEVLHLLPKGRRWAAVFAGTSSFLGLPRGG